MLRNVIIRFLPLLLRVHPCVLSLKYNMAQVHRILRHTFMHFETKEWMMESLSKLNILLKVFRVFFKESQQGILNYSNS
jgi:hypothetical protein